MQRSVSEQGAKQMFAFFRADISSTLKPEYCFPERKQTAAGQSLQLSIGISIHISLLGQRGRQK